MNKQNQTFDTLFDHYKQYVYKICYQFTRSVEDASDLTQETFVRIYKNMDKIQNKSYQTHWIRRICVNLCLNYRRDHKETMSIHHENEKGLSLESTLTAETNTESQVLTKLTVERLEEHIHQLAPETKMAVLLRHQGLSYKEIAQSMDRPEGSIKTLIFKGRQTLYHALRNEGMLNE